MITKKLIFDTIVELCFVINTKLPEDVEREITKGLKNEKEFLSKKILDDIIENNKIANKYKLPMCQDTGICVFFIKIGSQSNIDFDLTETINEATKFAYKKFYFRNSIVESPINRKNTLTNTPVIIHYEVTTGKDIEISISAKGAGSENMSAMKMISVHEGIEGIKKFVVDTVKNAGGKACPPISLGIGIGGDFEYCSVLAKKALMLDIDHKNPNLQLAKLEDEILKLVNETGIGPMGFGGKTTCISVKILEFACHIASLPVAVNINCHAARHKTVLLKG